MANSPKNFHLSDALEKIYLDYLFGMKDGEGMLVYYTSILGKSEFYRKLAEMKDERFKIEYLQKPYDID